MEKSKRFATLKKVHEVLEKIMDMDMDDVDEQFLTMDQFNMFLKLDASIEDSMLELLEDPYESQIL